MTDEQRQTRITKLRRRALAMAVRYRAAELDRITKLENRFVGHLEAATGDIKNHMDSALAPVVARLEGRVPARREDQTAGERKLEVDQALLHLRNERKELVAEERREREQRPSKRREVALIVD